jgi:hypothetical protein
MNVSVPGGNSKILELQLELGVSNSSVSLVQVELLAQIFELFANIDFSEA